MPKQTHAPPGLLRSARNDNKKAGNDNKKGRNDTHSVTLSGLAKGLAMRAKKGQNYRESCHCEDRSKPAPAKAGEAISWGLPRFGSQ